MKRTVVGGALIAPAFLMIWFWLFPETDTSVSIPIFHFYIVTFTTFAAAVIALLLTFSLGEGARPRHLLASVAFAEIGILFFTHGIYTPNAIIDHFHPAVTWSAWLTLFAGGILFALSTAQAFDKPNQPRAIKIILQIFAILTLLYLAIAAFFPDLLSAIDQEVAPWHRVTIFVLTTLVWLFASIRHFQIWRKTGNRVDGALAFVSFWLLQATFSMHQFPLWNLSWWMYHFLLLTSFLVTVFILVNEYEQTRKFSLIRYYVGVALIFTGFLALLGSNLVSRFAYNTLVEEIERYSIELGENITGALASVLSGASPDPMKIEDLLPGFEGEQLGAVIIYDNGGLIRFPHSFDGYGLGDTSEPVDATERQTDGEESYVMVSEDARIGFDIAVGGDPVVEVRDPGNAPPGYGVSDNVYTVVTFTPIRSTPDMPPVGVLHSIRPYPELSTAIIAGRITGLSITAFMMGILFLALFLVVGRADIILAQRTAELEDAYTDLRKSEGIRDDLTNMIVHDLRNPLSAVAASIGLVKELGATDSNEHANRFINVAADATDRISGLIDEILVVSKVDSGELKIKAEIIDFDELLLERMNNFRPQAEKEKKAIIRDFPSDISVILDPSLMGRVIDNLISNAIKYVEPEQGRIMVKATQENGRLYLRVTDNGEGIPDDFKSIIFDKFIQAPDGKKYSQRKGTGLGLTFCKMVVEQHGGEIRVTDAEGGGSEFVLWVPN